MDQIPETTARQGEDSGNGSLMRLPPVAVRFSRQVNKALLIAEKQSLTTHPGRKAAESARFLAYVVCQAIERDTGSSQEGQCPMQCFLQECSEQFSRNDDLDPDVRRMVEANADTGTEANWNWKQLELTLTQTSAARGNAYRGYPNSLDYFGCFALDGLAIALHACYWSQNFDDALVNCVNHLGDADTTAAIAGQIAGAFYGHAGISDAHLKRLHQ